MTSNVIISRCFVDADNKLKKTNTRISLSLDEWEKLKGAINYVDNKIERLLFSQVWEKILEEYLQFLELEVALSTPDL